MDFGNTVMLRHILTHETMHIRRRDNWVKTVMLAAVCVELGVQSAGCGSWRNTFQLIWKAACDAAVLGTMDAEERQGYAYSLLAMAITGNRTALLYSAFSKTEVERRIKSILRYKESYGLHTGSCCLPASLHTTAVFATVGQAPRFPHILAVIVQVRTAGGEWRHKFQGISFWGRMPVNERTA